MRKQLLTLIDVTEGNTMQVLELVTFKTKQGVSKQQILDINKQVMEQVRQFSGFIYRSLCYKADSDTWLDVVYWQDEVAAKSAQEQFIKSKLCQQLMANVDVESTTMQHADILLSSCTES